MYLLRLILIGFIVSSFSAFAQKKETLVTIETKYGPIRLILYNQTPQHKANFLKLAQEKFYDGIVFHRVIPAFMIQGGNPATKPNQTGPLPENYRIPAEFVPALFHQRGALAAAHDGNPQKASSGYQFYIVQGKTYTEETIQKELQRAGRTPTPSQLQVYKTVGGVPHLDGNYTVFGQVIDGMAAVDSIAAQPRNQADRPYQDIRMTIKTKKMRKKKITRQYGYVFPS
ncbi:MAG: peptidylprolyl isomerase [Siphonobacter sp.]